MSNGSFLRVFWQPVQRCLNLVSNRWKVLERAGDDSHECASGQSWRELKRNHPANREMRPFDFDGFSSLTTLCRGCITWNVQRIMTSWRKKLPRISIAARSRKEPSRSFNVLNHWLYGLCSCHLWIKKSLRKISEPIGSCLRLRIDPMEWQRNNSNARTLGRVVTVT